jgi:hypothetical protein
VADALCSLLPQEPTASPTAAPTGSPTAVPTGTPTAAPTDYPTAAPTFEPTAVCSLTICIQAHASPVSLVLECRQ